MKPKTSSQDDQTNSGRDESENSKEFEQFENAVRRIMRMSPEEAERIRKSTPPPDPNAKDS